MRTPHSRLLYHIFVFVICVSTRGNTKNYFGYKVVRVLPKNQIQLNLLLNLQRELSNEYVEFWKTPTLEGVVMEILLSPGNVYNNVTKLLRSHGIKFNAKISDVQSIIEQQKRNLHTKHSQKSWFKRYQRLEEINAMLRQTANDYKGRVRLFSLGKSYEGRQIFAVEIKANQDILRPLVFINCGIHAREWVSPATCIYAIQQLASGYPFDNSVREVLDKVDFVILPVINVDGYIHSWIKDRLWRKNRNSQHGDVNRPNCVGVDLNRNWCFHWGESGASKDPCNDAYQGNAAMSEKEVKNVATFLESQKKRLVGFLDIHSYGQMILFPWGFTKERSKDHKEMVRVAMAMADAIKTRGGYNTSYIYGQVSHVLYEDSGTTKDYMYGHLNVKYTFSMELRDTGQYGFLLPSSFIEPTAKEAFEGIKAMVENIKLDN